MKSLLVPLGASTGLFLQTSTIDEANAFEPIALKRLADSVLSGHVPVMRKPDRMRPSRRVSQPVEDATETVSLSEKFLTSVCLKA
jgi:hypothetical protein